MAANADTGDTWKFSRLVKAWRWTSLEVNRGGWKEDHGEEDVGEWWSEGKGGDNGASTDTAPGCEEKCGNDSGFVVVGNET